MHPVRTLGALVLAAALTLACPPAFAADVPPADSTGFDDAGWTDPVSNDLFAVSGTSFDGTVGIGSAAAGSSAVTITARQDIVLSQDGWGSTPEGTTIHRAGACPVSLQQATVAMSAGDTCQVWFTWGPEAMDHAASQVVFIDLSATASDGSTAQARISTEVLATHLVLGGGVDFGAVAVGTTSAVRTVALRNIAPDAVEVDLTAVTTLGVFDLAPGQPSSVVVASGATTDVGVTFTPTSVGPASAGYAALIPSHAVNGTTSSSAFFPTLTGYGVDRTLALDAAAVDLGAVPTGGTAVRPVTVTNTGAVPVRLTPAGVVRPGTGVTVGTDELEVTLPGDQVAPGQSLTGTVTWRPADADLTAEATVVGTDAADPSRTTTITIPLAGTVAAAPVVTPPPAPAPSAPPTVAVSPPAPSAVGEPSVPGAGGSATGGHGSGARGLAVTGADLAGGTLGAAVVALLVGALLRRVSARGGRRAGR